MKELRSEQEKAAYLEDESRLHGSADAVFLPAGEAQIRTLLRRFPTQPITVQGARTGVAGGAVPSSGLVFCLERMNRILDLHTEEQTAVVEPGLPLAVLQRELRRHGLFFPPDPTETTASIGGMAANDSSGARSFHYGSTRRFITALHVLLADGSLLRLRRGEHRCRDGHFCLRTDDGRILRGELPRLPVPAAAKNTAGYYLRPDMDLIDLFLGSEGTLGIITRLTLRLLPLPRFTGGAVLFLPREEAVLPLVESLRGRRAADLPSRPLALEFFGRDALALMRETGQNGSALRAQSPVPAAADGALYVEFCGDDRTRLCDALIASGRRLAEAGGDPALTWAAVSARDLARLKDFRHAAPVSVNEEIARLRQEHPHITKVGTDMAVPDRCLAGIYHLYRNDLARSGMRSAVFGHIGNNHLHVNILPRSDEEYRRARALHTRWAASAAAMGGTVSAEHGIGKLKTWLLRQQYSREDLAAMRELKKIFDPHFRLGPGTIFAAEPAEAENE
ncbi:MAG: FAD-binding oxidoreductase [Anaerovoracaceae bacterium]